MAQAETSMAHAAVRPFRIDVPEEELVDLRRRIVATRWPDKRSEPHSGHFAKCPCCERRSS
jgi:hypothetical protein